MPIEKQNSKNNILTKNKSEKHDKFVNSLYNTFKKDLGVNNIDKFISKGQGDIDLAFLTNNTLVQFEVKTGSQKYIEDEFGKWLGTKKRRNSDFLKKNTFKGEKIIKELCFFSIPGAFKKTENKLKKTLDQVKKDYPNTYIVRNDIEEFSDLAEQVDKSYALREFLKDYNGFTGSSKEIIALAIKSPIGKNAYLYQFTCSANDLAEFATVSRRSQSKKTKQFYQRRVDGKRLTEIAKNFLDKGSEFVNNVILKIDPNNIKFVDTIDTHLYNKYKDIKDAKSGIQKNIIFGVLKIKMDINSAFIIDGQHRILSYLKANREGLIRVSALTGITESQEADYFLDINSKSKPVSADLIWDLTGIMDSNGKKGIISKLVKELGNSSTESVFYEALTVPSGFRNRKKIKISFSGLCRTFLDDVKYFQDEKWSTFSAGRISNPFKSNPEKMAAAVIEFFNNITEGWDNDKIKSFFNDAVIAVYIQFCYIYFISIHDTCKQQKDDILDFIIEFVNQLSNEDVADRRKLSNSADKKQHLGLLVKEVRGKFHNFGSEKLEPKTEKPYHLRFQSFEGRFSKWVINKIDLHTGNHDWFEKEFNHKMADLKKKNKSYIKNDGNDRELWTHLTFNELNELITKDKGPINFWKIFMNDILEAGFVDSDFWKKSMHNMALLRNPKTHGVTDIKLRFKSQRDRVYADFNSMEELIED